jgi:hypothetical protein
VRHDHQLHHEERSIWKSLEKLSGEQGLANGDLSPGDARGAAGTARSCTNGIFQECRNSPAMKGY